MDTDQQLIKKYFSGDEKALEILISRYLKPINNFVYRRVFNAQEAEDITQEVFVKVWRNIRRVDPKKSFKAWIFTIARNTAIDWLRKKKAVSFSQFENGEGKNILLGKLADSSPLVDELLAQASVKEMLATAISKLTLKYREVLSFRYNDNLTFREIAESLGESVNTIKSRHRRAIAAIKQSPADFFK